MHKGARTVLCGGRSVMVVPTASAFFCSLRSALRAVTVDMETCKLSLGRFLVRWTKPVKQSTDVSAEGVRRNV
jgi:hypothetical protein